MFWQSVLGGFQTLGHWSVWAGIAIYFILSAAGYAGVYFAARAERPLAVFGTMALVNAIQLVIVLAMFIALTPIVFGLGNYSQPELIWPWLARDPLATAKFIGGIFVLLLIGGAFGLTRSAGISQLIVGGSCAARIASVYADAVGRHVELWPGLLNLAGYVVIAFVLPYAIAFLVSAVFYVVRRDAEAEEAESVLGVVVLPISAAAVFLPVFMYAAWLGIGLRSSM
jgi:hypothetical protein